MIVHDCAQRSAEWFAARLGKLTASDAAAMLATLKSGGEPAIRRDLRTKLVLERITNQSQDSGYINQDMQRGFDQEPAALAAYELETGHLVRPIGFCAHDSLLAGCSPDGFCDDGGVEVKCPRPAVHLGYLKAPDQIPPEHLAQIVHTLWITDRPWWDFCSFNASMPEPLQLLIIRKHRDEREIASYELLAVKFLREIDAELNEVRDLIQARSRRGVAA